MFYKIYTNVNISSLHTSKIVEVVRFATAVVGGVGFGGTRGGFIAAL